MNYFTQKIAARGGYGKQHSKSSAGLPQISPRTQARNNAGGKLSQSESLPYIKNKKPVHIDNDDDDVEPDEDVEEENVADEEAVSAERNYNEEDEEHGRKQPVKRPPSSAGGRGGAKPLAKSAKGQTPSFVPTYALGFTKGKSYTPASNLTEEDVKKSGVAPVYDCTREHIYGLTIDLFTNSSIHSSAPNTLVYGAGNVGVIHNLETNTQSYYTGHYDDISCMTLSKDGKFAATGCVRSTGFDKKDAKAGAGAGVSKAKAKAAAAGSGAGKEEFHAVIHIWKTSTTPDIVLSLGSGFFDRAVSSVVFSSDLSYICGVGADDAHHMGMWALSGMNSSKPSAVLVADVNCLNGLPRDLKCVEWAEGLYNTSYISKEHNAGGCDLLCSTGERHLRLWSFKRPADGSKAATASKEAMIVSKSCVIPQEKIKQFGESPKTWTSACFIKSSDGATADLIAAGSNGIVYLWRQGAVAAIATICKGSVDSVFVKGNVVYCGGSGGTFKILDATNLNVIAGFNYAAGSPLPSFASDPSAKAANPFGNEEDSSQSIVGIASSGPYIFVSTSGGRCIRIDPSNVPPANKDTPLLTTNMSTAFYYHTGTINGLTQSNSIIATSAEDKRICLWDIDTKQLVCRYISKVNVQSIAFDGTGKLLAAGLTNSVVTIFAYIKGLSKAAGQSHGSQVPYTSGLKELTFRKDAKEQINDIKFSPDGRKVAAGSGDNFIYIYSCETSGNGNELSCALKPIHKISGHSSFITHLDWSLDNLYIQSNCGAYDLLCWNVATGKAYNDALPSDIEWATHTCVLGGNLMGIWEAEAQGNDINSVDVSPALGLCVTGDDNGKMNLLNYPCLVKRAPRKVLDAHSSHVTGVHFINRKTNDKSIVTEVVSAGGRDTTLAVWKIASAAR